MANGITNRKDLLRPLALVGALILAILAVGLAAQFLRGPARSLGSLLSSISFSRERIDVGVSPATVFTGEPFVVSWTHEGKSENGSYELSHPCLANLKLALESRELIPCDSGFAIAGQNSITLLPESTREGSSDLPITITFIPDGADRPSLSGSKSVTIMSRSGTETPPTAPTVTPRPGGTTGGGGAPTFGSSTSTITSIAPRINPNGTPDLKLEIVGIGILATSSNTFVSQTSVGRGEKAAIVFDVKNIGDNVSGEWTFKAQLPVPNGGDFLSETQPSILPGNGVQFTLGFENLNNPGANTVTILVDPEAKIVRDPNRLNNSVSLTVTRNY